MASLVQEFAAALADGALIVEELSLLEADEASIKAGHAATEAIPSIGGSVGGVAGKFTGTLTFTPGA